MQSNVKQNSFKPWRTSILLSHTIIRLECMHSSFRKRCVLGVKDPGNLSTPFPCSGSRLRTTVDLFSVWVTASELPKYTWILRAPLLLYLHLGHTLPDHQPSAFFSRCPSGHSMNLCKYLSATGPTTPVVLSSSHKWQSNRACRAIILQNWRATGELCKVLTQKAILEHFQTNSRVYWYGTQLNVRPGSCHVYLPGWLKEAVTLNATIFMLW